jgi:hypothetical protein
MMLMRVACLVVLSLAAPSCRDARPRAAPPGTDEHPPRVLPELPGFTAGDETRGDTFVRRTYARGPEKIDVTLARFPMTAPQYDSWLRMSTADFPQADLGLPSAVGNGFYQCATTESSRCDLLVQLRCGIHLEIRGQGIARRQDADELLAGLDLPTMARTCLPDGGLP